MLHNYLVGWCGKWFSIAAKLDEMFYDMYARPHVMLIGNILGSGKNLLLLQ
jgi:hypothetical protein